jgi:hypothetical protein
MASFATKGLTRKGAAESIHLPFTTYDLPMVAASRQITRLHWPKSCIRTMQAA